MHRFRSLLLLLPALIVSPTVVAAQAAPPSGEDQLTIPVTVTTRNGDPVEGLTKDDFTLLDNKHEEPITGFKPVSGAETNIAIVLDAVNLPYSQVAFARQQLVQFFASNGGHLAQPMTLGVLQDSGLHIQPTFTTDGNALRSLLDHYSLGLRSITRSSGVYGADERQQISLNALLQLISSLPKDGPKRVIWISPGWPLLSGPNIEVSTAQQRLIFGAVVAISTELRRSNIILDVVNPSGAGEDVSQANYYEGFLRSPKTLHDTELGSLGLQVIAQHSGGLVLNGSNDIAGLIQHTVALTKAGYELTFTPAPGEHANEFHELQLKLRRPGQTVHAIAGYYARPDYPALPAPPPAPPVN